MPLLSDWMMLTFVGVVPAQGGPKGQREEAAVYARVSTLQGPAERADEAVSFVREKIVPLRGEVSGSKGILTLVDRVTGRVLVMTFWETGTDMVAARDRADQARDGIAEALGGEILSVEEYEVGQVVGDLVGI